MEVAGGRARPGDAVCRAPISGSTRRPAAPPPLGVPTLCGVRHRQAHRQDGDLRARSARIAARRGLAPIVVAMGRGGPPEPQVAEAGSVGLDALIELVRVGQHAASDYLEDALTTGVTTIGARRSRGRPRRGAVRHQRRGGDRDRRRPRPGPPHPGGRAARPCHRSLGMQGSSSYRAPARWNTSAGTSARTGSCERTLRWLPWRAVRVSVRENGAHLLAHLQRSLGDAWVVVTDLQPTPLADVAGRRAFFATTAPIGVAERQVDHLEPPTASRSSAGRLGSPTEPARDGSR